jgi:multidrug efflux pump subunit AcrB
LKPVTDVYSVVPFGGQKLQMQLVVDRDRLAAYRMTLPDLRNALDQQNLSRPAGTLTYGKEAVEVSVIPQPEASSGVMRKGSHHGSVACEADGEEKAGSGPEAGESLGRSA